MPTFIIVHIVDFYFVITHFVVLFGPLIAGLFYVILTAYIVDAGLRNAFRCPSHRR